MTDRYPMTLLSPSETAELAEVKRLVFDYLASHREVGVERVTIERLLLSHGYNPRAATRVLAAFRKAGAIRTVRQRREFELMHLTTPV